MSVKEFPIESSLVLMFAYAIGDDNPYYADAMAGGDEGTRGLVVPPTFTTASRHFDPDSPLRRRSRSNDLDGENKESRPEPSGTGMHAEQHFEYHRPVVIGDVLIPTVRPGESWEREGRRGGRLLFRSTITEFRNQEGELVITGRGVSVRTERPVSI